nr:asparagine--tRNA ligase [Paratrimastix eleionoma]
MFTWTSSTKGKTLKEGRLRMATAPQEITKDGVTFVNTLSEHVHVYMDIIKNVEIKSSNKKEKAEQKARLEKMGEVPTPDFPLWATPNASSLAELVKRNKSMPNISNVVDTTNLVSLETKYAICACDAKPLMTAPITLRLEHLPAVTPFTPISRHPAPMDIPQGQIVLWNPAHVDTQPGIVWTDFQQSDATKISSTTSSILVFMIVPTSATAASDAVFANMCATLYSFIKPLTEEQKVELPAIVRARALLHPEYEEERHRIDEQRRLVVLPPNPRTEEQDSHVTELRISDIPKFYMEHHPAPAAAETVAATDAAPVPAPAVAPAAAEPVIKVRGWVHRFRASGTKLAFVVLRDGTGFIQAVLNGVLAKACLDLTVCREATMYIFGTIKADARALGGHELEADYFKLVQGSYPLIENTFNDKSLPDLQLDVRHIALRREKMARTQLLRSILLQEMRTFLFEKQFREVTAPSFVETQCEGGSTLFKVNYFGDDAYLTQSSQLYLEAMLPVLGNVFCCQPSFRAERSRTRRHLSEFLHLELEMPFIDFNDFLTFVETFIAAMVERMLDRYPTLMQAVNPTLHKLKTPFRRLAYKDAIEFCKTHDIKNEGKVMEFGDDIPEGPERKMIDMMGEPVFMTRFPAVMKSFYMKRCDDDRTLTESSDLLIPTVGEVVGGSMRMSDYDELMHALQDQHIDPANYYWYVDQRKFGSTPHGGFGLGFDRLCMWLFNLDHIRDSSTFPRYFGRCSP